MFANFDLSNVGETIFNVCDHFEFGSVEMRVDAVDLKKSKLCEVGICLPKSASIQPRKSLFKKIAFHFPIPRILKYKVVQCIRVLVSLLVAALGNSRISRNLSYTLYAKGAFKFSCLKFSTLGGRDAVYSL